MNKLINYLGIFTVTTFLTLAAFAGTALGQSDNTKLVGIDPSKNVVQLSNNAANPLSVKVENAPARKPFQARVIVEPRGTGFQSQLLPIPAGKRLVIENVSAITRAPEGIRMEVNFFTHMDNDEDGVGGIEDIVFHRIALIDQGVFDGIAIAAANHKMLVYADSKIGDTSYGVVLQARLNQMPPAGNFLIQAQLTVSGYLEDLPAVQ